ncbi:hypothetical protein EV182_002278, partial [Spiromyces aspiralis]
MATECEALEPKVTPLCLWSRSSRRRLRSSNHYNSQLRPPKVACTGSEAIDTTSSTATIPIKTPRSSKARKQPYSTAPAFRVNIVPNSRAPPPPLPPQPTNAPQQGRQHCLMLLTSRQLAPLLPLSSAARGDPLGSSLSAGSQRASMPDKSITRIAALSPLDLLVTTSDSDTAGNFRKRRHKGDMQEMEAAEKRRLSNRESARRLREKKKYEIEELEKKCARLHEEARDLELQLRLIKLYNDYPPEKLIDFGELSSTFLCANCWPMITHAREFVLVVTQLILIWAYGPCSYIAAARKRDWKELMECVDCMLYQAVYMDLRIQAVMKETRMFNENRK